MAWITVVLFMLPVVTALGITPARTTLVFDHLEGKEFKEYSGEFWVVNRGQTFTLTVAVEGELAPYIELNTTEIYFQEDESALPVRFTMKVPKNLPPGESTSNIILEQDLEQYNPAAISAKVVLRHKISIIGSYPDKYVNVKIKSREDRDTVKFIAEVKNVGKENINQVKTTFYVYDQEQKQYALETETSPLNINENKVLTSELNRSLLGLGEFEVLAVTKYDGEQQESRSTMVLSQPMIDTEISEKRIGAEEQFDTADLKSSEPLTGKATTEPKKEYLLTSTWFWILVGMILTITAGYIIYRYVHRNEYEGGDEGPI